MRSFPALLSAGVLTASALTTLAQTPAPSPSPIPLWPEGKMPGKAAVQPESVGDNKGNVLRLTNVSHPTITVYPAPDATKPAPALIVSPGGGYGILAYDKEGTEIASWLNTLGLTAVVLKYRVPGNPDGALDDIERAIRTVRANAAAWKIDPKKIGVIGFSAGGHLSARLTTNSEKAAYPAIDAIDEQPLRPDFTMLIYPAYLADKDGTLAKNVPVSPNLPPFFVVQAEDDSHFIAGTKLFVAALQEAKVPVETYFAEKGGHGYGLRGRGPIAEWPKKAEAWLKEQGVL